MAVTENLRERATEQRSVTEPDSEHALLCSVKIAAIQNDLKDHQNAFVKLVAILAAGDIAKQSLEAHVALDRLAAWDDETSVELIADCFATGRRLVLVFSNGEGTPSSEVTRISDASVRKYPPQKRPYNLTFHIGWLLGSD